MYLSNLVFQKEVSEGGLACKLWAKLPLPFMEHVVRVGEGFIRVMPLAIPSCVCAIPSTRG